MYLPRQVGILASMKIRSGKVGDVQAIHDLISDYAQLDRMIYRPITDIYEDLQRFSVAVDDSGEVVGCCALQVIWSDLAEIKSLAVGRDFAGKGIGKALVGEAVEKASRLGIGKVFTLTLEPVFFEKVGFVKVAMDTLPMKVWSDCAKCSKQDQCDEIAMVISV